MTVKNSLDALEAYKNTGTLDVQGLSKNGTTIQSGANGVVTASEVVIVDANKDVSSFRNVGLAKLTSTGINAKSVAAITAGTTQTQAGATAIVTELVKVTTGNANDGVLLPALLAGQMIVINNASANAGKIYGNGTETLNGTAGNAGSTALGASKTVTVICITDGVAVSYTN